MADNLTLVNKILDMVSDLFKIYPNSNNINLFLHLLNKTQISKKDEIGKIGLIFKNFLLAQEDAIKTKDETKFNMKNMEVRYSKNIFIKFDEIFKTIDENNKPALWAHLIVLLNHVKPSTEIVDIFKPSTDVKESKGLESLIEDIASQVSAEVDLKNNNNPIEVMNKLSTSGAMQKIMTDVTKKFETGELDMNQIFASLGPLMEGMKNFMPQ